MTFGPKFGLKTQMGLGLIALGDSFTLDQGGSTPAHGYSSRVAAFIGGARNNSGAVAGSGTTTAAKFILGNPALMKTRRAPMSILAGFNDVRRAGLACIPKVTANIEAALAAAFIDQAIPASSMKRGGVWQAMGSSIGGRSFALGGTAMCTMDADAWLEWDFWGDNVLVGAYASAPNMYRNIKVTIDNGSPQVLQCRDIMDSPADTNHAHVVGAISGLGRNGWHKVRLEVTDPSYWTAVDYVGTIGPPGARGPVLVGEIPGMKNWTYNGVTIDQSILDQTNDALRGAVAKFEMQGYPVTVVPIGQFYQPDLYTIDGWHPDDSGHYQIAMAFNNAMALWA